MSPLLLAMALGEKLHLWFFNLHFSDPWQEKSQKLTIVVNLKQSKRKEKERDREINGISERPIFSLKKGNPF